MDIRVQRLGVQDIRLLDEVTRMCMATVLESIPEFGGDARRAQESLPNFTFEQMRAMLEADCGSEAHRIMAAVGEEGQVCGYSAYSLKRDSEGRLYGYLFSRGIAPQYRRRGIAAMLLAEAERWFRDVGAEYIRAETHVSNVALRSLLGKHGFSLSGPVSGRWPYYILRKELSPPTRRSPTTRTRTRCSKALIRKIEGPRSDGFQTMNEDAPHRELTSRIESLIGTSVESYRRVEGGYTPALRLLCKTSEASFFAKIGTTPGTCQSLRREIQIYNSLSGDFMPRLVASEENESAPILIIEDLSSHYWPPPWDERHINLTLAQIAALHNTRASVETYAQVHGTTETNWAAVAAEPEPFLALGIADAEWLEAAVPLLIRYEEGCSTEGESLTHWDLRSDNMCITAERAVFIDWNGACLSNPTLDLGFWLPSLAYESGIEPEKILPDAPEVAARVSGYFASRAGLPKISDAPRVRVVQRRQLETALPWAVRALDLPPPTPRGRA